MKKTSQAVILGLTFLLYSAVPAAAVGNDSPNGVMGDHNGQITTGGGYDIFTGNAKRIVTDLEVTGSVGAYPLRWTRILNTRGGRGWQHAYSWGGWVRIEQPSPPGVPPDPEYEGPDGRIAYPDGRTADCSGDPEAGYYCGAGDDAVERLVRAVGGGYELRMNDGGKVIFSATINGSAVSLRAQAIVDPYGQTTTFSYDGSNRLSRVTEPAGRYLEITYNGLGPIGYVQAFASAGRLLETVSYTYQSLTFQGNTAAGYLTQVNYDDSTTAYYTYQAPNVWRPYDGLINTCDDVRFAGPMKKIKYEFATGGNPLADFGQLKAEKNVTTQQTISQANYPSFPPGGVPEYPDPRPYARSETRGDGTTRSFQFGDSSSARPFNFLSSFTDFKNQPSYIDRTYVEGAPDRKSFTNARGKTSHSDVNRITGAIKRTIHADGRYLEYWYSDEYAPVFVTAKRDERDKYTFYDRDGFNRIWQTRYPDGGFEQFIYNGFGQVESHRMTSGGVENFRYDTRGRKVLYWPPPTPSDLNPQTHPTIYEYYETGPHTDRLLREQNPRGYSTWYEYNLRGQVTKLTHHDGTYVQNGYNPDGTLAWTADENHPGAEWDENQRTRYGYDEYKRVTTVTNPLNQTTTYYYGRNWSDPLVHTTSNPKAVYSPMGKTVHTNYDENWRKLLTREPGEVDAWTFFGYDAVGDLTSVQDPRGNVTTFEYDDRNRKISATDPAPFQNQVTRWEYDDASNQTKITRPDNTFSRSEYDAMNRVIDTYGFGNEHTHYGRDVAGNVTSITDAKEATYGFAFDAMNRKTTQTYPADATGISRTETWHYDAAGNIDQYTNPTNQVKTFTFNNRNREIDSWWNTGQPSCTKSWDVAGRMTRIATTNDETVVAFGYDDANRQVWEDQTLAGYPTRRVNTPRDADGNRASLEVPGSYLIWYDYTQRNQLAHIKGGGQEPWYEYQYDASGNLLRRTNQQWGDGIRFVDGAGGNRYDVLNRPTMVEQMQVAGNVFARNWLMYDANNRLTASWRDEDGTRGERYGYDAMGQLTSVAYNAEQVWTGTPLNATGNVSYNVDALNRTGANGVNANGMLTAYTPNQMNQYTNVGGGMGYDGNFNLSAFNAWGDWTYQFDAENRLVSGRQPGAQGPVRAQFTYDGLGRCVKRTLDGQTTLLTYDGWKPIVEWDGAGNFTAWNVYGAGPDEILSRYTPWTSELRYHADRQGNVFVLLQGANAVERYSYDAFGLPTAMEWSGNDRRGYSRFGNRFMFNGREFFAEMGIMDYRNRWYHPALGRFLQPDPIGFTAGDMNLFRYCGGDPVNRVDPMGLDPIPVSEELDQFYRGSSLKAERARLDAKGDRPRMERNVGVFRQNGTGKLILSDPKVGWEEAGGLRSRPPAAPKGWTRPASGHDHPNGTRLSWQDRVAGDDRHEIIHAKGTSNERWRPDEDRAKAAIHIGGVRERFNERTKKWGREKTPEIPEGKRVNGNAQSSADNGTAPSSQSTGPSAAEIDALHQATGVPSLGQEAVNFAPGKP